ncbi:MAG: hypothetical protein ABIG89_07260 [Candidatus Woesearchaeota archaeon]
MIIKLIYLIITFAVSAIPLNIAVKMLGGKSSWLKAIIANIAVAILSYMISLRITKFSGLLSFIILLLIYKFMFRIGWFRAFIAWLLQLGIIALFWVAVYWLIGIMLF